MIVDTSQPKYLRHIQDGQGAKGRGNAVYKVESVVPRTEFRVRIHDVGTTIVIDGRSDLDRIAIQSRSYRTRPRAVSRNVNGRAFKIGEPWFRSTIVRV